MSHVVIKKLPQYDILYDLPKGTQTVVLIGGRGGAKTYEASKYIAVSSTIKRKRVAVLRDEKSTIKDSIFNEVLLRYDTANANGRLSPYFERNENEIKDRRTGMPLVFTKGFRASSKEKKANLKGVSDVDIAVIEEAEDIRDVTKFNTFADSIRKEGAIIIIILNTPDINHWIVKRYFNVVQAPIPPGKTEKDVDGFYELIPKDIKGFVCIQTCYKDNPYLPAVKVAEYEGYGDPNHHLYDWHHYMTNILGYASSGRKGQVFNKTKPIKLKDYLELPFKEVYGVDWGTGSHAGIVGVKFDGNNLYARQINYDPMDVKGIAKLFCKLGLTDDDVIIADSAGKMEIGKLRNGFPANELSPEDIEAFPKLLTGFTVYGVVKYAGSIQSGISLMNGMNIFVVEESIEFWSEVTGYIYATDKWGNYTNDPIDDMNHLWDPTRYIAQSRGRFF